MARIHKNNLVNHGVLPLLFENPADYDGISQGDELLIENAPGQIRSRRVTVQNRTRNTSFAARVDLTDREVELIVAGGQLRYVQQKYGLNAK
jgi:aconitate hydratase